MTICRHCRADAPTMHFLGKVCDDSPSGVHEVIEVNEARESAKAFIYDCPLCKVAVDLNNEANVYDEEYDEAIHAECVESYRENQNEAAHERSLGDAWAGGFAENH